MGGKRARSELRDRIPRFGFGGASVGNLYRATSDAAASEALAAAMAVGFTYIDTAPHYGHGLSEVRIGAFLRAWTGKKPVLSTKVGRLLRPSGPEGPPDHGFVDPLPFTQVFDYGYDGVLRSFDDSCARLGTETVDILYMHDIGAMTHGVDHATTFAAAMDGGYKAMAQLKAEGRVAAIGLGVNEWEVCQATFAHAEFDCFMLAGRYTLLEQAPLENFLPECERRGVGIVVAGPLNSGLLARRPDQSSRYNYVEAPLEIVERSRRLFDFCDEHGVPAQAAALQFPLLHPAVVSVVSGMSSADRVLQAAAWADAKIPAAFWHAMKQAGLLHPAAPIPEPVEAAGTPP